MSPLHLLWIIPLSSTVGMMTTAFMVAAHNADEWKDKEDEEDNEHKNDL